MTFPALIFHNIFNQFGCYLVCFLAVFCWRWDLLGLVLVLLGDPWVLFGSILTALEAAWIHIGSILDAVGASWAHFGSILAALGATWVRFGVTLAAVGAPWACFGYILTAFEAPKGSLWDDFDRFASFLASFRLYFGCFACSLSSLLLQQS